MTNIFNEINEKKNSVTFFFGGFFSVQKVNHNYDLNLKFEQKIFKTNDRTSSSRGKWRETKEAKNNK